METSPNLRMTFLVVRFIYSHPSIQATLYFPSTWTRVSSAMSVLLALNEHSQTFCQILSGCVREQGQERWWRLLVYIRIHHHHETIVSQGEADYCLALTILPEAGSQDLTSCQVRNRAHIVTVESYVLIATAHPSVHNRHSVRCHPQVSARVFEDRVTSPSLNLRLITELHP
jgi:hypothetical protein